MRGEASFNERGFVYVLTNRAYPGLVKVGCTARHPITRARELSGTGCPFPFVVAWAAEASDFRAVERAAHAELSEWRISENREFFGCEVATARRGIQAAARPWLRRRLLLTAPRRSKGRERGHQRSGVGFYLVGLPLLLVLWVGTAKPRPAIWWPPGIARAAVAVEWTAYRLQHGQV
jgi:hypothetical protein